MEHDFWIERWNEGRTAFHRDAPHPMLVAHHDVVLGSADVVYVPLCGKSVDLVWLQQRGHRVVGSELSPLAVEAFFSEQGLTASHTSRPSKRGAHTLHQAGAITIFQGDAFDLRPEDLQDAVGVDAVDGIWDRAAIIALHPSQRRSYQEALWRILRVDGVLLQVTFIYDQARLDGPPWSVDDDALGDVYGAVADLTILESLDEPLGPRFVEAGVTSVTERCFRVQRRGD